MSSTDRIQATVYVSPDALCAELAIPATHDPQAITPGFLRVIAEEAGVCVTPEVQARLEALADEFRRDPRNICEVIARATPPTPGTDATWQWTTGYCPQTQTLDVGESARVDHYASRISCIQEGTVVARMCPPTDGSDGCNVKGEAIPARRGHNAAITLGDGLEVRPDGSVVATRQGVLRVLAGAACVLDVLEVQGSVDYSTGHIDFNGSVVVADSVRDRFTLRATGDITVRGQVEGAVVICGGNLNCPRGVASPIGVRLLVEQDADVGYLDHAKGVVKGNLIVRREIVLCHLIIGGELRCESGSIIGGSVSINSARIGVLGSEGWTPTLIRVGELPLFASELRDLDSKAKRIADELMQRRTKIASLEATGARLSASARESMTELSFEISELERTLEEIDAKRTSLRTEVANRKGNELHVERAIYPRVRVRHGNAMYEFEREIKGPLQLFVDSTGSVLIRIGNAQPKPVMEFAKRLKISEDGDADVASAA